ncbi:MAG: Unknown protein [uncultured Campylobacterales bacterium]|uniref:Probable membrane transporter protein n=1 Tax=uncultured Campylobacterales bacterium TaxID=352960 RepID=A0A6S6SI26_9BACT|nr:MAG: Unknown protein [uncultured Campylobacterales bacterium]
MFDISIIFIFLSFFIGFSIQGIFGFAGAMTTMLIAMTFTNDIASLIYLCVYPSIGVSTMIIFESYKNFDFKSAIFIFVFALLGTILGSYIFDIINHKYLLIVLGIVLMFSYLFNTLNLKVNHFFSKILIFVAGVVQGITSTGGPLNAMGIRDIYKNNKNKFRIGSCVFALTSNISRIVQYQMQGNFDIVQYIKYWPIIPITILSSIIGIKIKNKISDKNFSKYISYVILLCGFIFLYKGIKGL